MNRVRPDDGRGAELLRSLSRTPPGVYVGVVIPVLLVLAATVLQPWLPPSDLLRDSQVVAARHVDASPAYGLVSNLGIIVLALTSGAAAVGWLVLREAPGPWARILLWAGALTLVLALDDLLLLHEASSFAPGSAALVAAAYGLAFLRFVARFGNVIVRDLDVGLLVVAAGALGISLLTDILVTPTQASVVLEDGAKLLGIVAWCAFVVRTTLIAFARARSTESALTVAPGSPRSRIGANPDGRTTPQP